MKTCPVCGQEYADTFLFCEEDGADLIEEPEPEEVPLPKTPATGLVHSPAPEKQRHLRLLVGVFVVSLVSVGLWKGCSRPANYGVSGGAYTPPIAAPSSPATEATPTVASGTVDPQKRAEIRLAIEALYKRSERGFVSKNVDEYFCYTGQGWIFVNDDHTSETRDESRAYMAKLFQSDPAGKEHTTSIVREIATVIILSPESMVVHVWVTVSKSTGRTIRFKQTDYWSNPDGRGLLCSKEVKGIWEPAEEA